MEEVRVRFAPSPTGFLHVGGARTAIFNWLYAKSKNGKFLLRIEDTDAARSKSELSEQILSSLKWLKMESDETIVYQSDNILRYRKIVNELLVKKKAYYSFDTLDELKRKRDEAKANNQYYKSDRAELDLDESTIQKHLDEGRKYTIRFLVPKGVTKFDDIVHGKTSFQNSEIDDFVIQRSDGSPVYQVAVVVDDHDMNITHVIRGDDHLSNTPKQIVIYNALGWKVPQFAHLPMILDENKKKLSKRKNPVAVEEYRDKGYLRDALFNFLTLLGYAPHNNVEIISREELVKTFTFDRVNKKSAVFDMKKLDWINFEYIKMKDENELAEMILEKLKQDGLNFEIDYIKKMIPLMRPRVTTINDFVTKGKFFFKAPGKYDEKVLAKYGTVENKNLLNEYLSDLTNNTKSGNITVQKLEQHLRSFAESKEIKAGAIIHPLRLALTGTNESPGIFELMEVLGLEEISKRIGRFVQ
jgi:glutamyl-tRNA synthetase